MSAKDITFPSPVTTTGLAGFPDALHDVAEARRVVDAMRLPVVRSRHAWLDVANPPDAGAGKPISRTHRGRSERPRPSGRRRAS